MKYLALILCLSSMEAFAEFEKKDFGYLKPSDQTYYKNDSFEGQNKWERIDSAVKEINKVEGEMAAMKQEIANLKGELAKTKEELATVKSDVDRLKVNQK